GEYLLWLGKATALIRWSFLRLRFSGAMSSGLGGGVTGHQLAASFLRTRNAFGIVYVLRPSPIGRKAGTHLLRLARWGTSLLGELSATDEDEADARTKLSLLADGADLARQEHLWS